MLKLTRVDPTAGPIAPNLMKYAIPIFLTSIIQTLMNATDAAVLGNMADSVAVASVGATSSIVALLVSSMLGISEGAKIMLARSVGARDFDRCRKIMNTSLTLSVALGALIAIAGAFAAKPILVAMNCPDDCIDGAALYLSIYLTSAPLTLLYNFGSGIIAISGDSVKPMKYMLTSGISNIILNIILCLILPNKVAAVAIATVAGTGISSVLVIRDLLHHDRFPLDIKRFSFSLRECFLIFKFGIPVAFNSALFSISNIQIQSAINSFGSSAIAGNTASVYVENIPSCVTGAFSSSTLVFVGQNIGANQPKRVKMSIFVSTLLSFTVSAVLGLSLFALGKYALSIFVPGDAAAVSFGLVRMKHILPFYGIPAITGCLAAAIQAFGFTYIPMSNSMLTVLLLRVLWMEFIYPKSPTAETLYLCYTVSWLSTFLVCVIAFAVIYPLFRRGKLKKI